MSRLLVWVALFVLLLSPLHAQNSSADISVEQAHIQHVESNSKHLDAHPTKSSATHVENEADDEGNYDSDRQMQNPESGAHSDDVTKEDQIVNESDAAQDDNVTQEEEGKENTGDDEEAGNENNTYDNKEREDEELDVDTNVSSDMSEDLAADTAHENTPLEESSKESEEMGDEREEEKEEGNLVQQTEDTVATTEQVKEEEEGEVKEEIDEQVAIARIPNNIKDLIDITISMPPKEIQAQLDSFKVSVYVTSFSQETIDVIPITLQKDDEVNTRNIYSLKAGQQKQLSWTIGHDHQYTLHVGREVRIT